MTDPVDRAAVREMFKLWRNRFAYTSGKTFLADLDDLPSVSAEKPSWQPIKTAPKDGTVVIGFDMTKDDDDGLPHGVDFMRTDDRGVWIDPLTNRLSPTHWMPLPSPPAPATAEKETP